MENEASISLTNLHAGFHILVDNGCVCFQLVVTDRDMETLTLYFYTLEDVIMFTEDVVSKYFTKEKVWEKYQEMCEKDLFCFSSNKKLKKKI